MRGLFVFLLKARECALCLGCAICFAGAAHAQIVTDGSLGSQVSLTGPNYIIDPALGQQRGANLFHSFSTLNVGTLQSAQFDSATGTTNIIARVTGGFGSQIDGTLTANANLYLLNPQGILVGANAVINVAGSLHLSTADYIRLGSNAKFYANLGPSSVLSTAAPSAFGFLDGAVAPIRVVRATLHVADGESLSLIGGDVTLEQTDLTVAGGRINFAAAAGPGEVVLGYASLDATSLTARGDVRLSDVSINRPGTPAANVYVRAGQFVMESGSSIAGNAVQTPGVRDIDIEASAVLLRNSRIDLGALNPQPGLPVSTASIRTGQFLASDSSVVSIAGGGDLSIVADQFSVNSGSSVGTTTAAGGRAGNLVITANAVSVDAGTLTTIGGDSAAGDIAISADSIDIRHGGIVSTTTTGAGAGGSISIATRTLTVDGSQSTSTTGISAGTLSAQANAGDAGQIIIDAGTLQLQRGSISSTTNGAGRGGDIHLSVNSLAMTQGATVSSDTGVSGSQGMPAFFGNGGAIVIDAESMQLSSGARISASTLANGAGGSITVHAAQLQIDSAGAALATGITANSGSAEVAATGNGGGLFLNVNELTVRNQGQIASNAFGSGRAGRIEAVGNSMSIASGGVISASSYGQAPSSGSANDINIVTRQLDIEDFGQITNSTTGAADAGRLVITADQIRIANGGLLQSSSYSEGAQAGAVGDMTLNAYTLTMNGGSIHARSFGGAAPGRIEIDASSVVMTDGALVSTTSAGSGDAGFVMIRAADMLRLGNSSRITTEALNGSGGNVQLLVGNRLQLNDSAISTSVLGPAANGGNIFIDPMYVILGNSQIIARAIGGSGGRIDLVTQILIRDANSSIDATSTLGISGRVDIAGLDLDLEPDFAPLTTEFLSERLLQVAPCAARGRGNVSQFTVTGRDGAYRSPVDYLQSPLLLETQTQVASQLKEDRVATLAALTANLPSFAPLCFANP